MTTTAQQAASLVHQARHLAATIPARPAIPPGLTAGARLTLLADHHRARTAAETALDAAETALLIATGALTWDLDYPELAGYPDPWTAAADRALGQARHNITLLATALTRAAQAAAAHHAA